MDFIRLTHPISKRVSSDSRLRAFPIDRVPDTNDERPFTGIYTGLSVEIIDPDAIKLIHSGGSFGLSTKTKNVPVILQEVPRARNINQTQYEQKLAWNEKFGNQNSNPVMVNLLPKIKKNCVEILEKSNGTSDDLDAIQNEEKVIILGEEQPLRTDENSTSTENETIVPMQVDIEPEAVQEPEPELNLVEDPFPIEETLALLPEEAFFLHYSLRCLRVMDFNQTHELTTYEMLEKFCTNDAKFIQKFVVYHHYRSKNWVVKSGIKFGGEFRKYLKLATIPTLLVCVDRDDGN